MNEENRHLSTIKRKVIHIIHKIHRGIVDSLCTTKIDGCKKVIDSARWVWYIKLAME